MSTIERLPVVRLFAVVYILAGIIISLSGVVMLVHEETLVKQSSQLPGMIVEMETVKTSRGNPRYYPIFTFTDPWGIVHTQRATNTSREAYRAGEQITVLFDPTGRHEPRIYSKDTIWIGPMLLIGFGFVFLMVVTVFALYNDISKIIPAG